MTTLDVYLSHVGLFGPAQYAMIATSLLLRTYIGWPAIIVVFVAIDVPFQCVDPQRNSSSSSSSSSSPSSSSSSSSLEANLEFDNQCVEGCIQYQYDLSVSSMVSEFDLACGIGPTLVSSANSAFWIGFLISCFVTGPAADRFGRRLTALGACGGYAMAALLLPFSRTIYEFIALRFMTGLFNCPLTFIVYIIVAEWIPPGKLALVGMTTTSIFELGEVICALVGYYLCYSWRSQLMVLALPALVVFASVYITLPESARWLFQVRKLSKCEKVLRTVASRNGKEPPVFNWAQVPQENLPEIGFDKSTTHQTSESHNESDSLLMTVSPKKPKKSTKPNWLSLFKTGRGAFLISAHFLTWFSFSLVFYGLMYNVSNLSGDIYLNTCLLAITAVPAWFVCFAMNYFGRKNSLLFCLFASSVACLSIPFSNQYYPEGSIYVALTGKCLATAGYNLIYVYTAETVPTQVRSSAMSVCSACARLGTISAPFIIQSVAISEFVPYVVFTATGLLSFLFCALFAVETLGRPMSDTIEQYFALVHNKNAS